MRNHRILPRLLVTCVIVLPLAGCAMTIRVDPIASESATPGWSRVGELPKASAITVTREGGQPASRTFVAADESELIALNLTDATLPRPVTRTLRDLASDRSFDLFKASYGQSLTDGPVRLEGGGIFLDGQRVAALDRVLERTARSSVTEVRRTHRATTRGLAWGLLIGGGLGLAVTLGSCGTNWSQETSSCTNLTPLWIFAGPAYGALIGSAVGATLTTSTVVYPTR